MENSRFSSLIYRIIGKPDRWHDDYIDVMHQILDETDSFDDAYNFRELAVGDQIISSLRQNNEALAAFNSLLDKSRFKMIILDDDYKPIYHNKNADSLALFLRCPNNSEELTPGLLACIKTDSQTNSNNSLNTLVALDYQDENNDQIYLRSIQSNMDSQNEPKQFFILMVLDQSHEKNELNDDLIAKYELTSKEQLVVRGLIHGKGIKAIAEGLFISDNTVKTHLKAIFRKTDTNSQAAVVRLMLTHESQILDSYFDSNIDTSLLLQATSNDREIVLASGDKIAYCEYGPADGRPILVFHNGYGCRLSIPPNFAEVCERTNRRIIIPDRPGTGKTPYIKGHPEKWNHQLNEFIDLLALREYEILGSVMGCQMALHFAMESDQRLQKIILCSPVVINQRKDTKYLTGIFAPSARLVRASKHFAREIYELWLKSITLNLGTHYKSMLESSMGSAEQAQFQQDGTLQLLVDVFQEGSSHSLAGISKEMVFCMNPLKLDLDKITVPVDIWYGSEDQRISLQGAENAAKYFSNHKLIVREGYSEHIYFALFEEIIA
jgi:pimeloyl-ACP methyl ester carboxylesterase/DNA-binding CsgD family transcriptional regulator